MILLKEDFFYDFKIKYISCIPIIIKDFFIHFYLKNKNRFSKNETLQSNNVLQKIIYDLEKLKVNKETLILPQEEIIKLTSYDDKKDNKIYKKAMEYYKNLLSMIDDLLTLASIKPNSYDFNCFQKYFCEQFKILIENLKCKYFYYYFWCKHISERLYMTVYAYETGTKGAIHLNLTKQ